MTATLSTTAVDGAPAASGSTATGSAAPGGALPAAQAAEHAALPTLEGSLIARFVALLTPVFVLAAGWLAGVAAHHLPGLALDQTQIVAFMVAVSTAAVTASLKWLQGWQQHERLVAAGTQRPVAAPVGPGDHPATVRSGPEFVGL